MKLNSTEVHELELTEEEIEEYMEDTECEREEAITVFKELAAKIFHVDPKTMVAIKALREDAVAFVVRRR